MKTALSTLLLASIIHGCGDPTSPPPGAQPDAATGTDVDVSTDVPVDVPPTHDVPLTPDVPPTPDVPAVRCADGTACDGLLDADGLCHATCVAAQYALTCHGTVHSGVCYAFPPPATDTYERDGWERSIVTFPTAAAVDVPQTVVFSIRNTTAAARPLSWRVTPLGAWTLESEDPPSGSTRELAAGASVQVTLRVRTSVPNALDTGRQIAATVAIDGVESRGGWPLFIPVSYPVGEGIHCGERWFPEYIAGASGNYGQARCCGGVFYPGAQCCVSSDCAGGGVCADGRCLRGLTTVAFSATPFAGPQRVLLVLVDDEEHAPAADPCADRSAELRDELGLADIERWYAHAATTRVGRPTVSWRWTVLAGLRSAAIGLPSGSVLPEALHRQTEAWLQARGCLRGFDQDHDRTLVYSPRVDLGPYGGMVFRTQRIAQNSLGSNLLAHELGHTFGATDRYTDLGGSAQWAGTLMSNTTGLGDDVRDDVFWAEVGFGDADRDGVIDLHQAALAPDELRIATLRVTAFPMSHALSYALSFDVRQGGRALRNIPQVAALSLPGTSVRISLDRWDALGGGDNLTWNGYLFAPRDISQETFDAIVRDNRVRVRVEAGLYSTRPDFTRAELTVDETRDLELTPRGSALLPPPRPVVRPALDGCGH